jgi:dCMP deaminase
MKREDYISWDAFFMGLALLACKRSKDPSTQVGAVLVGSKNQILSVGYNGFPRGCSDDSGHWKREGDFMETKYARVCHAELNTILLSRGDIENTRLYVTLFPCNECAKAIIQSGVKEIIYYDDKYADADNVIISKALFDEAGIKYYLYEKENKKIEIEI